MRDDVDYVPCENAPLLSQHFSAIAAAGPIVGPILAGVAFGLLPALIWILVGSILSVACTTSQLSLLRSVIALHRSSKSSRIHISGRAYLLFLAFVWLALVYIVSPSLTSPRPCLLELSI